MGNLIAMILGGVGGAVTGGVDAANPNEAPRIYVPPAKDNDNLFIFLLIGGLLLLGVALFFTRNK